MTAPPEPGEEQVVLVDDDDRPVGREGKLAAHVRGALHRAVSVFVTDGAGRVLLQQRAAGKYHSPGLWTNTSCGHPRPGESEEHAAARRLADEMGVRIPLEHAGTFRYRAVLENGLIEHEIDHVFVGRWTGDPVPDPTEAGAWRWVAITALRADLVRDPAAYTAWLAPALDVASRHPLLAGGR